MKKLVLACAGAALAAGCSDSGTADADGDGAITAQVAASEMADGPAVTMRAGMWEHKVEYSQLEVPGVPAGMQEMVKNNMGSGITSTRCLAEDEVREPDANFFGGEASNGCSYDEFDRSGNRMTMKVTCQIPQGGTSTTAMEGQFGADSYTLAIDGKVTGMPTGDVTMKGTISGRRIGDC